MSGRSNQRLEINSLQAQLGLRSFDSSNRLVQTFTEPVGQYEALTAFRGDIRLPAQAARDSVTRMIITFFAFMRRAYSRPIFRRVTPVTGAGRVVKS